MKVHLSYIVALIIAAVLALHFHDAAVRAQALAQARSDSLHAVTVTLEQQDQRRAKDSAAASDSIRNLMERDSLFRVEAKSLATQADGLAAELRSVLGGVRLVAFDSLMAVRDSVDTDLRGQITSLAAALAIAQARWHASDSAATAWRSVAENAEAQVAAALKRQTPKFACVAGPGLSVGWGSGAGATVACGLRLR